MKTFNITILLLFLITGISKAQFVQDIQGRPIMEMPYTNFTGTPFLYDNWVSGMVTLENGSSYKNIFLKYSVFKDELFFKNPKEETLLAFVEPVKSFLLEVNGQKDLYRNGFPDVDSFTKVSFYQVLFDGSVKLLYKNYKSILETRPYNSATVESSFNDNNSYFVLNRDKMMRFKPSKKEILELFKNKSTEVDEFIKKEKINFKSKVDLVKLFEFYSSL